VGTLAVLAQHLTVVARRRHQPPPRVAREGRQQPPDLPIHVGDFFRVAKPLGRGFRAARRGVGRVGIVVVNPEGIRPGRGKSGRPGQRGGRHRLRVPLGIAVFPHLLGRHVVVVRVEPAGQAEAPVEDPRRDERPGGVAACRQDRRERGHLAREDRGAVVAYPVGGVEPGEERAVGGKGEGGGGQGPCVARPPRRQRVEVRGPGRPPFVATQMVGTSGVQGEEDHGGGEARLPEERGRPQTLPPRSSEALHPRGRPGRRARPGRSTLPPPGPPGQPIRISTPLRGRRGPSWEEALQKIPHGLSQQ